MIPGCRFCEAGQHDYCENDFQCACCYSCSDCGALLKQDEPHYLGCEELPQWVKEREQK